MWCTYLPDASASRAGVAFAIGRTYGNAVVRNRLRRRLRAIMHDLDMPSGWWLFGARPTAVELTFDQLGCSMRTLVGAVVVAVAGGPPVAEPARLRTP